MKKSYKNYEEYLFKERYCNFCRCYACGERIEHEPSYQVANAVLCLNCLYKLGTQISEFLNLCKIDE